MEAICSIAFAASMGLAMVGPIVVVTLWLDWKASRRNRSELP